MITKEMEILAKKAERKFFAIEKGCEMRSLDSGKVETESGVAPRDLLQGIEAKMEIDEDKNIDLSDYTDDALMEMVLEELSFDYIQQEVTK